MSRCNHISRDGFKVKSPRIHHIRVLEIGGGFPTLPPKKKDKTLETQLPEPEMMLELYHEGKLMMISTHKILRAKDDSMTWTVDCFTNKPKNKAKEEK